MAPKKAPASFIKTVIVNRNEPKYPIHLFSSGESSVTKNIPIAINRPKKHTGHLIRTIIEKNPPIRYPIFFSEMSISEIPKPVVNDPLPNS